MRPIQWPHPVLQEYWDSGLHASEGATQPAIQNLLYHLVRMVDAKHVVELGVWKGATSRWLACAVGDGSLTLVDTDQSNVKSAAERVRALHLPVKLRMFVGSSLLYLSGVPRETDFVFLDDDKQEIPEKLGMLVKALPHCVVAIHDLETIEASLWKDWNLIPLRVAADPSGGDLGLTSW